VPRSTQRAHNGGSPAAMPSNAVVCQRLPRRDRYSPSITAVDGDRWFSAGEAVAYGLADVVIGGPAGTPESGTPV
jgi:hypothetical protein